jgi:Protein of unknown function (DUF2971)
MDRYFKYLDANGARPTLLNRTLRWSRPSRFNDLFDMGQPYSIDFDAEFVMRRALELMWDRLEKPGQRPPMNLQGEMLELFRPVFLPLGRQQFAKEMRPGLEQSLAEHPQRIEAFGQEILDHMQTLKVLCLSSVHDDNALWGLYADNHRGVVLEFANVEGVDSPYRLARPIVYSDHAPPLMTDEELAQFLAGDKKLSADLVNPLMFLKSSHWSQEKELRIISGDGRYPDAEFEDILFHPLELAAVYFGARSEALRAELEPSVIELYPHTQRWQAFKGNQFRIEFKLLDGTGL